MKHLSRKHFLRGAAGAALALPLLESLGPMQAQAANSWPRRLVLFFTPGGYVPSQRLTSTDEVNFELGPTLEPLADFRDDVLLVDDVPMPTAELGPGDAHAKGAAHLLTGLPIEEGQLFVSSEPHGWASGPSVDQVIAKRLGDVTPVSSLQLGVMTHREHVIHSNIICYAGASRPIPALNSPRRVFEKLFGVTPGLARERSRMLDLVREDLQGLRSRIDARDREQLDLHLEKVDALDRELATLASTPSCTAPVVGSYADFESTAAAQTDLLVSALRCDLSRVAVLQLGHATNEHIFEHLGITAPHHSITHKAETSTAARGQLVKIERYFAERFAALLRQLRETPEGDGTLLDHTAVVWVNELDEPWHATSATHTKHNYVLAGARDRLVRGRRFAFPSRSHNDLLVTLTHLMDVPSDTFGVQEFCSGPLPVFL